MCFYTRDYKCPRNEYYRLFIFVGFIDTRLPTYLFYTIIGMLLYNKPLFVLTSLLFTILYLLETFVIHFLVSSGLNFDLLSSNKKKIL